RPRRRTSSSRGTARLSRLGYWQRRGRDGRPDRRSRGRGARPADVGGDHAVRRARAARSLLPRAPLPDAASRAFHPDGTSRRRAVPAGGIALPPTLTLEPRRRRASQAPLTHAVPTALTYGAACERIDTASNREQIAEAFVEYAKGRCDALVVLLIRDGNALG